MTAADYWNPLPPPDALVFWVIYSGPADMPEAPFVVRPQYPAGDGVIIASAIARSAPTIEEARALIPGVEMLYRQVRDPSAPLAIIETWF